MSKLNLGLVICLMLVQSIDVFAVSHSRNVIIITDMEPDDRIALEIAQDRMRDRIAFIGTTVMNAERKAALVRDQLRKSNTTDIPVFAGTGGRASDYPSIASSLAAREYEQEGRGILSGRQLQRFSQPDFGRSSGRLQTELERALSRAASSNEKIDFMMLAPPTDLVAVLERNPALKAGIGEIHIMGGWVDVPAEGSATPEKRTTYNWNMDPVSSAKLLSMSDISMTLYSSHTIKPAFGGGSINRNNAPEAIAAIEASSSLGLQTFRRAGESWDSHLMERIPPLRNVIGDQAGKQFTPADPLVVVGMLNQALITSSVPISAEIDLGNLDPARGFKINVLQNPHSNIRLVTGLDTEVFGQELVRSLSSIERNARVLQQQGRVANSCRRAFGG